MRRPAAFALCLLLAAAGCGGEAGAPPSSEPKKRAVVGLTRTVHVDRVYRSMAGPLSNATFTLQEGPPELLWITAYRTEVVGDDGREPASGEFMCHTNVVYDGEAHAAQFGSTRPRNYNRLFTTSQGQFEVDLPEGFGIPVMSNETLGVNTQVLNLNDEDPGVDVRFRLTLEYLRDAEAGEGMKPLSPTLAYVMALVEGDTGVYGIEHPTDMQSEASCMPGNVAPQSMSVDRKGLIVDALGRRFTGHWVVPPGREVRRTLVNELIGLSYDTTIHYIGVHLHPFAESLELRDLTTGETVYRADARGPAAGIGLEHVEHFASVEGIPIHADHDYEMVSIYDNTSDTDQDAMATFFVYLYDPEAERAVEALRQGV